MTDFDRLDWHLDAALERRRPAENAFAHIGLFLAWLIRHDLVAPGAVPMELTDGVRSGALTGSALRDPVADALSSTLLTEDGAAFTEWYYPQYLDDFAVAFADAPDYGVADTADAYARISPTIDRRFAEWLALDDANAAPDGGTGSGLTMSGDVLRGMSAADLDSVALELADAIAGADGADAGDGSDGETDGETDELGAGVWAPDPTDDAAASASADLPHDAPDLEALLPMQVLGTQLERSSIRAREWQSSLLRRAIQKVGGDPAESFVAVGLGGLAEESLAITLYAIPGVAQDRLEAEFSGPDYLADGQRWQQREVDGKAVWWATAEEFDTAFYALGGLVVTVGGSAERVQAALDVLP